VIHREDFDALVHYHPIDMLELPGGARGGVRRALVGLGGAAARLDPAGLDFMERSLVALKPGGIAVHTMEYNIGSNDMTLETHDISAFRRRDIEALASRLQAAARGAAHQPASRA
jgi:hypothetical protein